MTIEMAGHVVMGAGFLLLALSIVLAICDALGGHYPVYLVVFTASNLTGAAGAWLLELWPGVISLGLLTGLCLLVLRYDAQQARARTRQ